MTSRKRVMVGLPWHSMREGNLGVGAFTLAHVSMLKTAASAAKRSLAVCIYDAVGGPHWYPPDEVETTEVLYDLWRDLMPDTPVWRAVGDCDLIMDIGAGELSSDIYGADFAFAVFNSRMVALAQRKPMIMSPQTIGPFNNEHLQVMTEQVIRRCERTFTRDDESFQFLRGIGVKERIESCADLAFRLPFSSQPRTPGRPIHFGLNVSGLLYLEESVKKFSFGLKVNYPSLISRIIRTLRQMPDVHLVLVPHCVAEGSWNRHADDVWVCEQLAEEFGLPMAPRFKSPIEAKSFISDLDILAGSRLHATIAAVSSGVAVIPLGHTRKFTGVFGSVDYPLVCDLRAHDEDGVLACVRDAMNRIPELRAAAVRSNAIAQSKLDVYQAYLNQLMTNLP